MKIAWNIVTRNLHGHEPLRKKLNEKIAKLEKHLKHFPPDTVHLHITLERHPRKEEYTAALMLRVPSNILQSTKSADDVIKAFDDAVKALLRELEALKADLRREPLWKRKARREQLHELNAEGFSPEPQGEGAGPQKYEDVVRDLFQQHYRELLRHARRHIRYDELAGDIPRNSLDARDIVDEVARQVITKAQRPQGMNWIPWFYHLIHEELKRQCSILKQKAAEEISIDETKPMSEDAERAEGYDVEQPLDIIEEELEPPIVRSEGLIPDPRAQSPDQILAQQDALKQLERDLPKWPRQEREVFELYYFEGLEPQEIAMVTSQPLKVVRENIASIQQRLREQMLKREAIA
jgi:ribosomal subunit interface protein